MWVVYQKISREISTKKAGASMLLIECKTVGRVYSFYYELQQEALKFML